MGVGLAGVAATPAMAAGTGVIAGTVTGAGGVPLSNVLVQLFYCDPNFNPTTQQDCWTLLSGPENSTYTASNGTFNIPNRTAGQYKAIFHPQSNNQQYVYEYWDNKTDEDSATAITVTDGATTTINPSLVVGATITGTVKDTGGGAVAGGYVYAWLTSDPYSTRGGASVASDGSYTISGLPAGEYYMQAGPQRTTPPAVPSPLLSEYWDNKATPETATRFTLALGQSVARNFELTAGGTISGKVTNASSANLEGIDVTVMKQEVSGYWSTVRTVATNASGDYVVDGLQLGEYVVRFSDFGGTYAQKFAGNVVDRSAATKLTVGPGANATGINAQLAAGGGISGVITQTPTGGAATPSVNGYLTVIKVSGGVHEEVSSINTTASGAYSLTGLAPGAYTIQAYGDNTGDWAWTYRGSKYYPEEATTVTVAAGAPTAAGTTNLVPGTWISGRITDANNAAVPGVRLTILYERTPGNWVAPPPHGGAGDDIVYSAGGMPPGKYMARFEDTATTGTKYVTQYYSNKPTQATATIIDATNGGDFTNVSAVMTKTPWPAPTASATASPATPNGSNGWYKSGNVTVTLTSAGGTEVADKREYKIGSGAWTTYTAPISVSTNGTTTITYRASEEGLQTSAEGTLTVKRDTVVPTVSSSLSGRSVTVASADTGGSGVATTEYRIGTSGSWTAYTAPVNVGKTAVTIQFRATDAAGNVSTVGSRAVPAQTGSVTVTTSSTPAAPNSAGWYKSDVTVTGSGTAELGGTVAIQSKMGDGAYSATASQTVSTNGTTIVTFKGTDETGNTSAEVTKTVKLDKALPTVEATLAGSNVLTVTGTDALSGVALREYKIGTGSWTTYTAPVAVGGAAVAVQFRATDAAGNVSAVGSLNAPKGTATVATTQNPAAPNGSNGWYKSGSVTVTGTGTATASGATVTVSSKVGSAEYTATAARTVSAEGTTVLTFRAQDQWGNVSSELPRTIKLDKTVPTVSHSFSGNALTLTGADSTSGIDKVEYRVAGSSSWVTYSAPVITNASDGNIEYRATDKAGLVSAVGTVSVALPAPQRIAGTDRFHTSVLASKSAYPSPFATGTGVVYVASGMVFPDALGAGPAAAHEGGPLLLVPPSDVPASVIQEIQRLKPKKIVVIGGEASVSAAAFNQIKAISSATTTTRVAGSDRFDTSRKVTAAAFTSATVAYISTGMNFPDALAGGGAAGAANAPVILVQGGATDLDQATAALLTGLGVDDVKVLGGTASVSAGIEADLKTLLGASHVKRFAGDNRFETARLVNKEAFIDTNASPSYVFLSTGLNFPDALAGSAWAAKQDSPLYTVSTDCIPPKVLADIKTLKPDNLVLLGGTPSLSEAVANLTPCAKTHHRRVRAVAERQPAPSGERRDLAAAPEARALGLRCVLSVPQFCLQQPVGVVLHDLGRTRAHHGEIHVGAVGQVDEEQRAAVLVERFHIGEHRDIRAIRQERAQRGGGLFAVALQVVADLRGVDAEQAHLAPVGQKERVAVVHVPHGRGFGTIRNPGCPNRSIDDHITRIRALLAGLR